jgi:hypothetical protein
MGGVASDFGSFIKTLMNDLTLRSLMLIPSTYTNNDLIDVYFCETVTSGIITTASICRVIITSNPQMATNNMYVKDDMLAIEVYVPNLAPHMLDRTALFERRSNQIVDEIISLFDNKIINGRTMRIQARHELACATPGFARMFVQFSYKRVYN